MIVEAPPRPRIAVPQTPYVGLTPFTENDAPFFFGREKERRIIAANLLASRLTLLYGASGVGKSSIIRAGIQRDFRTRAEKALASGRFPESIVVVFTGWRDDPIAGLAECVASSVRELLGKLAPRPPSSKLSFDDLLVEWNRRLDEKALQHAGATADLDEPIRTELLIIFDQFEQYFVYHADEDGPGTFAIEFPRAVNRDDLRASFLISLREDAYTQLDRFEGRILNLFASNLRIEHLDETAATAAIVKPVEKYNELLGNGDARYEVEPELVEAVIRDVRAGNIVLGQAGGGGVVVEHPEPEQTRVETPFLQLVMSRLWEEEQRRHSHVLRLETLRNLGGAERIVRRHLDDAMSALDDDERAVAARMFHQLVTPSGARIVHSARDLAGYSDVSVEVAEPILEKLDERRILRTIDAAPGEKTPRFEIRHDVLASAVVEWSRKYDERRRREEEEARRRQQVEEERRRQRARLSVRFGIAGSVLALLAVALGLLALVSFLSARDGRDRSRSREKAQTAAGLLQSRDPAASVRMAYEAIKIHDTPEAEEALRSALVGSHWRGVLRGHKNTVLSARFSPDGKLVVTASDDRTARIWQTATGRTITILRGHTDSVSDAALSPDGKLVVTASFDGTARVWEVRSGRSVAIFRAHKGPVNRAAFSPDGRLVVTASDDDTARVWNARTARQVGVLPGHTGFVFGAGFSPDGTRVVTAGGDGTARVWNVHSRSAIEILRGHSDAVYAAAFSPDGRLIVTASADGTARLWDTTEGAITLRSWRVRGADVAFSPKGPLMVIAGPGDVAQVWDAETLRKVGPPLRHQASVTSAAFSPDGKRIVTASSDGSLRIFQPSTGRLLAASEAHCVAVRSGGRQCVPARSASFSPKGNLLLTEDDDGIVRIRGSGNLRLRLAIPTPAGSQATFDPTGRLVVIVKDGHISRFDSKSGRQRPALPQPFVASAAFSPDGKQLVTQDTGGNVTVWNAKTNDSVLTLGSEEENASLGPSSGSPGGSVAFSPTGDLIATATPSGLTRLWEARSGRRLAILPGGPRPVSKIVTSSDDRFILTAGEVGPTLYSCQACLPIDDLLRLGHWTKEELRKPGE